MPQEIIVKEVTTFPKLLTEVEKFQRATSTSWYRGVRNSEFDLSPTLYRHPTRGNIDQHLETEHILTTRFSQRVLPYLDRRLTDDWDKLFLMQHYGVPTRLLDWTENPFIAAYFALESVEKFETKDASIWLCDPVRWNQSAFSHISYTGGIFDETNTIIRNHKPRTKIDEMPETPVMMFGSYNSPRIVAQRGVFSLFGKSTKPLNIFYAESNFSPRVLQKLVVPHNKVPEFRDSLFRKGFTETVVFPEIEGLARELKRENGF